MKTRLKHLLRFRSVIALALMVWSAGVACMLVSYAGAARASDGASPAGEHESMGRSSSSSMDAHACCKARHKSIKRTTVARVRRDMHAHNLNLEVTLPETPAPSGAMSCCPLTTGSILTASRSQANDDNAAQSHANSLLFASTDLNHAPRAVLSRLPNRAGVYLLDCAFLI